MLIRYKSGTIKTKEDKNIINDINFSLDYSSSLAIIGESGSGKTTLALSILKLLPSNFVQIDDKYIFNDVDLTNKKNISTLLGSDIVYIPQSGLDYLNPTRTIKHQMYDSLKKNRKTRKELLELTKKNLSIAGFLNPDDILNKYPYELSGGMATKVLLAISLCSKPKLVILDEATNGLDNESKSDFINKIKYLFYNCSFIVITHEIDLAKDCDEILIIKDGVTIEQGKSKDVLKHPKNEYTKQFISSLPKNGMKSILEVANND